MPNIINKVLVRTYTAEVAITANAVVVEGTADGQVKLPGAADAGSIVGVALHAAAAGEQIQVAMPPSTVECVASAAIARGAYVSIAATSGTIKTAAPSAGANTNLVGIARQAAGAANDLISVSLITGSLQG